MQKAFAARNKAKAVDRMIVFMTFPPTLVAIVTSFLDTLGFAQRSSGNGVAVCYGNKLNLALPAGAIVDQNRGPVSHVQRFLLDNDLRIADVARDDERKEYDCCVEKRLRRPNEDLLGEARKFGCAEEDPVSHCHCPRSR